MRSSPCHTASTCRASTAARGARAGRHRGAGSASTRTIDVLHRGLADPDDLLALLDRVGPVPGKGTLRRLVAEPGPLVVESIFQDDVARTLGLGYPADRSTHHIATADGVGLRPTSPSSTG